MCSQTIWFIIVNFRAQIVLFPIARVFKILWIHVEELIYSCKSSLFMVFSEREQVHVTEFVLYQKIKISNTLAFCSHLKISLYTYMCMFVYVCTSIYIYYAYEIKTARTKQTSNIKFVFSTVSYLAENWVSGTHKSILRCQTIYVGLSEECPSVFPCGRAIFFFFQTTLQPPSPTNN